MRFWYDCTPQYKTKSIENYSEFNIENASIVNEPDRDIGEGTIDLGNYIEGDFS